MWHLTLNPAANWAGFDVAMNFIYQPEISCLTHIFLQETSSTRLLPPEASWRLVSIHKVTISHIRLILTHVLLNAESAMCVNSIQTNSTVTNTCTTQYLLKTISSVKGDYNHHTGIDKTYHCLTLVGGHDWLTKSFPYSTNNLHVNNVTATPHSEYTPSKNTTYPLISDGAYTPNDRGS